MLAKLVGVFGGRKLTKAHQVNVKMSSEDFTTLQKAANALWPEAILSNSGVLLGLAKLAAKDILKRKPGKRLR